METALLQSRESAEEIHKKYNWVLLDVEHPIIIATKGHNCTGRKLVATYLAVAMKCPLIKEEDVSDNNQLICKIVECQIKYGTSVVIDSELSKDSHFLELENLAKSYETPLFLVECKPNDVLELWQSLELMEDEDFVTHWWDKPSSLEDLQNLINGEPYYDIGETPKFVVDVTPNGRIEECISRVIHSIADPDKKAKEDKCICASEFIDEEVIEERCDLCDQPILGPIYQCSNCKSVFHKSCTELPPLLMHPGKFLFSLQHESDYEGEVSCTCCGELLKGNFYGGGGSEVSPKLILFDINCMFLPSKRRVNYHDHEQLEVCVERSEYECTVCGVHTNQTLSYRCTTCNSFKIDPYCAWLPETIVYDRHRHPFKLSVSPPDEYNEYYCDICQEERDPKHLIYYCAECNYPTHIRCILPVTWPPWESCNK